ncbi:hypothetical protein EVAR_16577_1 [Eumeta japonica]|uniref:Uncharacterized protein n=1 Tax=Eumeta variegata TaxID=151549 RepID=A0A4C1U2V1_EUMVA|nr:hypothetical protein EVAR_16577_1 [Eumeta japonica]
MATGAPRVGGIAGVNVIGLGVVGNGRHQWACRGQATRPDKKPCVWGSAAAGGDGHAGTGGRSWKNATSHGLRSGGPRPWVARQGPESRPPKKLGLDLFPRCPPSKSAGGGPQTPTCRPKYKNTSDAVQRQKLNFIYLSYLSIRFTSRGTVRRGCGNAIWVVTVRSV